MNNIDKQTANNSSLDNKNPSIPEEIPTKEPIEPLPETTRPRKDGPGGD